MAFKMKGYQAHGKSPMKVGGKWSNWMANRQQFIGDEIEARRKKFALMDAAVAKAKSGEGDNGDDNKKDTETFQSYNSIIAIKDYKKGKTTLDYYYWNFSRTTSKYRNLFLNETTKETVKKVKDGIYKLANLNK